LVLARVIDTFSRFSELTLLMEARLGP
jgi:hypothetical protein